MPASTAGAVNATSGGTVTDSAPNAGTVAPDPVTVSVSPEATSVVLDVYVYSLVVPGATATPVPRPPPEIVIVPALTYVGFVVVPQS